VSAVKEENVITIGHMDKIFFQVPISSRNAIFNAPPRLNECGERPWSKHQEAALSRHHNRSPIGDSNIMPNRRFEVCSLDFSYSTGSPMSVNTCPICCTSL